MFSSVCDWEVVRISQFIHTRYWNVVSYKSLEDRKRLVEAASYLAGGRIVAFPTETVYGLGANALCPRAVERVYLAKGRPADNPMIVHIASLRQVKYVVRQIPPKARILAGRFWPGPLTLVMSKDPGIPDEVTAGLDTVAVRMPGHRIARELIRLSGFPIAAPSANISGKPSPTTARHVLRDLYGKIDGIVDGGISAVGLESTVLDVTGDIPVLLRPGGITREQLEESVGQVLVDPNMQGFKEGQDPPRSPGMKYTHYAPAGKVFLVEGEPSKAARWIRQQVEKYKGLGRRIAILCSRESAHFYEDLTLTGFLEVLGSRSDMRSVARHLYGALRRCDLENIEVIFIEAYSPKGIGLAVMNRMYKAAGSNIVRV